MSESKKRVVLYARVSTEHEAQLSALANQIDWYYSELQKRPDWILVEKYIDRGVTGTSAEKRPEFMRMMEDAKNGEFDLILVRDVSRFARNTVDALNYIRQLKKYNVGVHFFHETIDTSDEDDETILSIMAIFAQKESKKISERVKSGQKTSMENGVPFGNGNILGYDRKGKEMVINPEQAQIVKEIYAMYLDGLGLKQIKYKLEHMGVKTSTGKSVWSEGTISRVLKNSFYCGIIEYRKQYVPDYLEQKKVNNHGNVEKITVKGKHEPIVSEEDFNRVQAIMNSKRQNNAGYNKAEYGRGSKPCLNVWGRLLVCECGHKFNRKVWHKTAAGKQYGYQCNSQASNGSINGRLKKGLPTDGFCASKMFPEWKLQMMAKYIFRTYLSDIKSVIDIATKMLNDHIADEEIDNTAIISSIQSKIEKLKKRLSNLIDMRADGEISKQEYLTKKDVTENELNELNDKLAELLPPETENDDEPSYDEKLRLLRIALDQYTDFTSDDDIPDEIIEAFVEKIVVHKDSFDWHLRYCGGQYVVNCDIEGNKRRASVIEKDSQKSPKLVCCNTGCNKRIKAFDGGTLVGEIVFDIEKAKRYLYAKSTKRRVLSWTDIDVKIFI